MRRMLATEVHRRLISGCNGAIASRKTSSPWRTLRSCTPALVDAERIATVGERLISYRVMRADSAMATKDRHAFDFVRAIHSFRSYLLETGRLEVLSRSYATWAMWECGRFLDLDQGGSSVLEGGQGANSGRPGRERPDRGRVRPHPRQPQQGVAGELIRPRSRSSFPSTTSRSTCANASTACSRRS